ncbi:hypothetical protein B0H19DRAFT_1118458 [Mycena capillaripes]|nr:hypothetical protein B0H19DRAFT_1118458 [Mycena capillaripes]
MLLSMPPSTPVSNHTTYGRSYTHRPTNSSPLAPSNSSPGSSPIAAVQARRRSQYKARASSGPVASSSRSGNAPAHPIGFGAGPQLGDVGDDSQTAFLRTRLKLRCIERASKARERAVQKKRVMMSGSEAGSDDMEMDEDGEDDDVMFDELFSRIMRNTARKMHHAYMYSYDREVGSFDPDMEEPQNWETQLGSASHFLLLQSMRFFVAVQDDPDEAAIAQNLEEDPELQAYLEDQAIFADFADIPADDLFSWSDVDEDLLSGADAPQHHEAGDMDLS